MTNLIDLDADPATVARQLLERIPDAVFELLIRYRLEEIITGLILTGESTSYNTSINMYMGPPDKLTWTITAGQSYTSTNTVKGEVLSLTASLAHQLVQGNKHNKMNLLVDQSSKKEDNNGTGQ